MFGATDPFGRPTVTQVMSDPIDPFILGRFTELAARVLDVPVVHVSLVDEDRRKVVSSCGLCAPGAGLGPLTPCVGMRLVAADGRRVGTLTVMDRKARHWSAPQHSFLNELAVRIVGQVDIGPVEQMM